MKNLPEPFPEDLIRCVIALLLEPKNSGAFSTSACVYIAWAFLSCTFTIQVRIGVELLTVALFLRTVRQWKCVPFDYLVMVDVKIAFVNAVLFRHTIFLH